jgi:hypothetical protein
MARLGGSSGRLDDHVRLGERCTESRCGYGSGRG